MRGAVVVIYCNPKEFATDSLVSMLRHNYLGSLRVSQAFEMAHMSAFGLNIELENEFSLLVAGRYGSKLRRYNH